MINKLFLVYCFFLSLKKILIPEIADLSLFYLKSTQNNLRLPVRNICRHHSQILIFCVNVCDLSYVFLSVSLLFSVNVNANKETVHICFYLNKNILYINTTTVINKCCLKINKQIVSQTFDDTSH